MDADEVAARIAIGDLVARYNANGDAGRIDQMMELFLDDAVLIIGDEQHRGRDAIRGVFVGTTKRTGGTRPTRIAHHVSTHQVDLTSPATATGRCYFHVLSDVGLDHWGRYIDDYVLVDGGAWRFKNRRVAVDGYARGSRFR